MPAFPQGVEFSSRRLKIIHLGDKDHDFEVDGRKADMDSPVEIDAFSDFFRQPDLRLEGKTGTQWKPKNAYWKATGQLYTKEYGHVRGTHDAYVNDDGVLKIENAIDEDWSFPDGPERGGRLAGVFYGQQEGGFSAFTYLTGSAPPAFASYNASVSNLGHKCYFLGYYGLIRRVGKYGGERMYVDHHQEKGRISLRAFKGTRVGFWWDTPGYPGDQWTLWAALKRQFDDIFDLSFKALNGKDPASWALDIPVSLVMDWLVYLEDHPLDQTAAFLARPGIKIITSDGEERNPGEDDPDFAVDYRSLIFLGLGLGFDWDQRKEWQKVIHRKNADSVKWFHTEIYHANPITVYPGDTVTVGFGINMNGLIKVLNNYDIHRSKALLIWPAPTGDERKLLIW